jgi:drug/metabolite transporter (DMT)-like permease
MMFYRLIQKWGSVRAATVTYVIPAVTLLFDVAINSRAPSLSDIFGVLGVTFGVIILNFPARKAA